MGNKISKEEREESLRELRSSLKVGETLYTILRGVSRSGMTRRISVIQLTPDGPRTLDWHVARVLGLKLAKDGVVVSGVGMDMGFHLVYSLASVVFPRAVDGDRGTGYAFNQRWL